METINPESAEREPLPKEHQDTFANELTAASDSLAPLLAERDCKLPASDYAVVWAAQQRRALASKREALILRRYTFKARRILSGGGDNSYMAREVLPRVAAGEANATDLQLLTWSLQPPARIPGAQRRSSLAQKTEHHVLDLLPSEQKIDDIRRSLAGYARSKYGLRFHRTSPRILAIAEADRLEMSTYQALDPIVENSGRDLELQHLIKLCEAATTAHGEAAAKGDKGQFELPEKLLYVNDAAESFLRDRQAVAQGNYVPGKYEAPWRYTFAESKARRVAKRSVGVESKYDPTASDQYYMALLQKPEAIGDKLSVALASEHPSAPEGIGIIWAAMVQRSLMRGYEDEASRMMLYHAAVCERIEQFAIGRLHLMKEGAAPLWQVQIALDGLYGPEEHWVNTEGYGSIAEDKTAFIRALQAWLPGVVIGGKKPFKGKVPPRAHSLHLALTAEVAFLKSFEEKGGDIDELALARIGRILKPKRLSRIKEVPTQLPAIVQRVSLEVRERLVRRNSIMRKLAARILSGDAT